jgi:2-phosphosulfolactate phosphatase
MDGGDERQPIDQLDIRDSLLNQAEFNIHFEWADRAISLLAPISDAVIIVDVLSFSTAVEIATNQGAVVYPYRWKDPSAREFAESVGAEVADRDNQNGYSLSPVSLLKLPRGIRLVLPSPNGSNLSLTTGKAPTIAGCLRNCQAVAESAMNKAKNIAVIAAGERWEDGTLRPCIEDMIGAGAIIKFLQGALSPEAETALAAFENASSKLKEQITKCISGQEKLSRGEARDIELASELGVSQCVPVLRDGAFRKKD